MTLGGINIPMMTPPTLSHNQMIPLQRLPAGNLPRPANSPRTDNTYQMILLRDLRMNLLRLPAVNLPRPANDYQEKDNRRVRYGYGAEAKRAKRK
jgi:hypothetical protein